MAERAAKQLELNKSELPNSITEVIATLSRAGFDAYIVGGGVRDTLLGLKPKDFDAVTDAKPHEVKDVFGKRCRIIGRRFQLAHVYSGRELIEVATFRGPSNNDANTNQDGMIIRDNVWGDIKQDFVRRDFSINALYYQPLKGVVHDFCGALDDIRNKTIRLLGQASVRIEEDPVRLLRALRFKAKLGFEFDDELAAQFHDSNWARLEQISPHRLYDETQKMFTGGYLVPLLPLLFESGAIDSLIIYPPSEPNALVQQVAINTDKRINAGKSINPAFFYAALLWENYLHQLEKAKKRNMPFADAQMQAASKVIDRQRIKTAIPKFAEQFIRDIWILQPKLAAPRSKQIEQLADHPRFRAGFDFLLLREQCGDAEHPLSESTNGMGDWWQTYQTLSEEDQLQAIEDFDENIRRGAHKRGRGRNRQPQTDTNNQQIKPVDNNIQAKGNDRKEVLASHKQPSASNDKQSVVNDASNVPARRRRRADYEVAPIESQSKVAPASKARNGKSNHSPNKRTPRAKHDSNELALLQQLSLSSDNNTRDDNHHSAQPAPLFVIEHENVVPPLQKQLDKGEPSKPSKTQVAENKAVEQFGQQQQEKLAAKASGSVAKQQIDAQSTAVKPSEEESSDASKAKALRSTVAARMGIAQTPKLVSMNNAPIPYQRRRRQPSIDAIVAGIEVDDSSSAVVNDAKKAPKSAELTDIKTEPKTETKTVAKAKVKADKKVAAAKSEQDTDTTKASKKAKVKGAVASVAANANVAKFANTSKTASNDPSAANKGPIPAKRRRRQPSTNEA
ncbi:polynucleotide adenylyltransferase PcnB [Psychrobacter frigidicola]|uniref:Poly(A) polymerase I n=1 Tax=Psychrobacter frigidicola TaxID=45611 RepID=A0A5C7A521_9GAMM|nr:polynucleotide adenylyltransferase PcnB [Psychrobacter frigidicola]TXD96883.1 polynucleotide adenylyltransferase PcnB [Psychrobacter frigidicola]